MSLVTVEPDHEVVVSVMRLAAKGAPLPVERIDRVRVQAGSKQMFQLGTTQWIIVEDAAGL